jgi:hypothetical protein
VDVVVAVLRSYTPSEAATTPVAAKAGPSRRVPGDVFAALEPFRVGL